MREEIQELFTTGGEEGANILSRLAELEVRYLARQALEQEGEDHLGRGRYERRGAHRTGWPSGSEDARLRTAEGEVTVRIPQVRGGEAAYRSKPIGFFAGGSDVLERLVTEMYARGLSTRAVEDRFREARS
ncbi:MAG: hypothetical protein KatS3mg014_2267 [Actinomycetota bacterium]|nr:MAG: hypothetical protein KatS3mg014_2267 [Actinomycetota bacterium]